jgi:Xaa-Pro aminopeptidase
MFDLKQIISGLAQENVDGWLFYNFHNIDPSANAILDIPAEAVLTRRWFYFIPRQGEAIKLVHRIESHALDHLPGQKRQYAMWQQLQDELKGMLKGAHHICMQYSPMNAIPYVSYVDGGMLELVRSTGVEVHSSANLIQVFEAVWSQEGLASHLSASKKLLDIVHRAFAYVRDGLRRSEQLHEYQVQQFIMGEFSRLDMVTDDPPIVAVNEHSGDPHYEPTAQHSSPLKKGDFLLIDLWAKEKAAEAVYADITWVGELEAKVAPQHTKIFNIVRDARDAAVRLVKERFAGHQDVYGYEVDDAARGVIAKAGYGDYFIHRTGHSIGKKVHWKGVNIDNFETKDERKLIDGLGFSIEPGIYLKEFGVRSEIDMYIHQGKAYISGEPIQDKVLTVLA